MALPRNRQEFKQRILEDLGAPVIEINMDDKQIENAIDDALSFWSDYHIEGSKKTYIARQLTADDINTKQIELDPVIQSVTRVFKFSGTISGFSVDELFNVNYQMRLSLWDLSSNNLTGYVIARQYIEMIDDLLNSDILIRFREHEHVLYLDTTKQNLVEGLYIMIEAWTKQDPDTVPGIWSDRVLRQLATAYARKRWANNLTQKFKEIALPGGVTLDGTTMLQTANEEIVKYEEEFIKKYQSPDPFFMY